MTSDQMTTRKDWYINDGQDLVTEATVQKCWLEILPVGSAVMKKGLVHPWVFDRSSWMGALKRCNAVQNDSEDFAGGLCSHETRSGTPMGLQRMHLDVRQNRRQFGKNTNVTYPMSKVRQAREQR